MMTFAVSIRRLALIALLGISSAVFAQEDKNAAPYGSAKLTSYADIEQLKQLKAVWDFNFQDPKSVGFVFNNVAALLKATEDYGPRNFDPIKVVIVSHGPEVVIWAKKNYAKYKNIVDRAASFVQHGGRQERPFRKLARSIMPEDAGEEELLETAAGLHEFTLVTYRMYLCLESEGTPGDLENEREDVDQ